LFRKIRQAFDFIPKEHQKEVTKELINVNIVRVITISTILIFMNLFVICLHLIIYYPEWIGDLHRLDTLRGYAAMALERSAFIFICYLLSKRENQDSYKLKKLLVLYSCIVILAWCGHLSLGTHTIHRQIYTFIIGGFFVASVVFLLPFESLIVFSFSSGVFMYAMYVGQVDRSDFTNNVANVVFIVLFALLMSFINTSLYCKDQIKNKIIQRQSFELEESRNRLEDTVKKRTEELVKANEELIKEMGVRHDIELQSIRTKLLYEENEKLLNEFKEYEELRNVFFANLSHELRTPLNVIFSAQQMMNMILNMQVCDSCKGKLDKYNKIIKQNCYRLIRLIGNLIDITKIDAKYFEIDKKNCDIVNLIENITQSVAEYIKDKNIELRFESEYKQKIIACDPDKIERIMLNLLSNAVKFTPEHGVINIRLYNDGGYTAVAVKDSGIGISKEMQNIIFERFVQADKSTTRNREGSGIGLSLVKSLVDLHLGSITLDSELGKGSEFVVRLPDISIPYEDYIASSKDDHGRNIERINIEFSDIYS
jgi:signal transduction histidine kinase